MPTATGSEIKGYNKAERKVQKMARQRDTWMTPTTDADETDSRTDYDTWIQKEIEGWQSTTHFQLTYGDEIVEMAHDLADSNNLDGEQWIGIWEDLLTAFWSEWEEKHKTGKWWADKTIVIFRAELAKPNDVFALFPTIPSDNHGKFCTCYQHVGQHSGADYDHCIRISRPATSAEYADLKAELEGRGYVLIVRRRATAEMHAARQES